MFSTTFAYEFKIIGQEKESKDAGVTDVMMSWAGSIGAIVQCVTRLASGIAYDKMGFKIIFFAVLVVTLVNSIVGYRVRTIPWLYFFCILTTFFCFAVTFATFPAPAAKTFGPKYGA